MESNVIGARGELLASLLFPDHWVVRKLERDFGIDLDVELFRKVDGEDRYEATGQHLYVQVKASRTALTPKTVAGSNVLALKTIDTTLLHTVTAMGPSNPVILLHIDIVTGLAHWVCLNDYVDKYLRPRSNGALARKSTQIFFNPNSVVNQKHPYFWQLEMLSRRARTVSAFYLVEVLRGKMQAVLKRWQNDPSLGVQPSMADLRQKSGLDGLRGIVREILALNLQREPEFSPRPGKPNGRFSQLAETLSVVDEALAALYRGDKSPNTKLRESKRTYVRGSSTHNVRDLAAHGGSTVNDFVANLALIIESFEGLSDDFETRGRWVGLPFPAPRNAQEASKLYSGK